MDMVHALETEKETTATFICVFIYVKIECTLNFIKVQSKTEFSFTFISFSSFPTSLTVSFTHLLARIQPQRYTASLEWGPLGVLAAGEKWC